MPVGGACFQQFAPFDFQVLNPFSKPLVFCPEAFYGRIPLVDLLDPAGGALGRDLERTHQPQKYRAYGILFEVAPRRRGKNVQRKKKTETGAKRNLILTEKSELEGLNRHQGESIKGTRAK